MFWLRNRPQQQQHNPPTTNALLSPQKTTMRAIFVTLLGATLIALGAAATPERCICTAIFKPVCCSIHGKTETKSNRCQCGCAGGIVLNEGSCKNTNQCICPRNFDPTCCKSRKDGSIFTAANKCTCECKGTIIRKGKCKPPGSCTCPYNFNPVCCRRRKDGSKFTAPNKCTCRCEGFVIHKGKCSTRPPPITCANILCARKTPCCIETRRGPKCVRPRHPRCPWRK